MLKVVLSSQHILYDFLVRVSWEGHLARKQDIEYHAHGPHVALRVIALIEDLRRNVVWLNGLRGEDTY